MPESGRAAIAANFKCWILDFGFLIQHSAFKSNIHSGPQSPSLGENDTRHASPTLPSGDQSVVEPPGPIPNPEVKRRSADGSGTIGPVRVGRRQVIARLQLTLGPGSFLG